MKNKDKMHTEEPIDFVVLWVDGGDSEWKKLRAQYTQGGEEDSLDNRDMRYRDWDNMRYWFRAVEKYAPWVHKVYFVTNGQKPDWLNEKAEKLVFVKHSDYIDEKCLPTFNSHVIENNLINIDSLSEKFVYFNDDMFLTDYCLPEMFFKNGKPVHPAYIRPVFPIKDSTPLLMHVYMNMMYIINKHFDVKKSVGKNKKKWFNHKIGLNSSAKNYIYSRLSAFVGFRNEHLPVPIMKQTMREVWENENKMMSEISTHRFRSSEDVSQYLFRYWDLASGNFEPININKKGYAFQLRERMKVDNLSKSCEAIKNRTYKMICINDNYEEFDAFEEAKDRVNQAFEVVLTEKSSFEL